MLAHVCALVQTGWLVGQALEVQQCVAVPAPPSMQTSAQVGVVDDQLPSAWHARVVAVPTGKNAKLSLHEYVATPPTVVTGAETVPFTVPGGVPQLTGAGWAASTATSVIP
jgi:hypothetical protein